MEPHTILGTDMEALFSNVQYGASTITKSATSERSTRLFKFNSVLLFIYENN
jgi:hypothetical protein